jgi:hypothetical protein
MAHPERASGLNHEEAYLKADYFMDVMLGKILSIDKQIDKVHH